MKEEAARKAKARQRANTFEAVVDDFVARHVSKLRTGTEVEATIRRELISRWAARPLADINRRDIVDVLEEVTDGSGKYAAHKLFNIETAFFNWCTARGLIDASPCAGVRASAIVGRKEPRQRVLTNGEIRAL
jgi:integrase-like protein